MGWICKTIQPLFHFFEKSSQAPCFIKTLLSFLPNKSTRSAARKALARYEPAELLPILEDVSRAPDTKTDLLIQLPALAETMETRVARERLRALDRNDGETEPTVRRIVIAEMPLEIAQYPQV